MPPDAALPSGTECAALVRRSAWEPRPANRAANHEIGPDGGVRIDGANSAFNRAYAARVTGSFTGTTDEILQWGACKWGLDEDVTRARAVQESWWNQSQLGDETTDARECALIGKTAPCWQSYGILQVKGPVHDHTYPAAERSTPFNVDYAMAWQRACYDGAFSHWMEGGYRAGDEWGCVGAWYSGRWYDSEANRYVAGVREHLDARPWQQPGF